MPDIVEDQNALWSNYHLTIGDQTNPETLAPYYVIRNAGRYIDEGHGYSVTLIKLAQSAAAIQRYLTNCISRMNPAAPSPIGMTGKSWSFSELIGNNESQFDVSGISGCAHIGAENLHLASPFDARTLALVMGGTTLREIANWAKLQGLMIANSGTHLGPSIAGGYGTASHGSKLGEGGLQDMVVGVHLVTGEDSSVWLERSDRPVLTDSAIATLGARAIRNTAMFEDTLIHLGGMGIVNAVAVELVENRLYFEARVDAPLDANWAARIAEGSYQEISDALMQSYAPHMVGQQPLFYEVTFNPHDYKGPSTLHILYYEAPPGLAPGTQRSLPLRSGDAVVGFLQQFLDNPALVQSFTKLMGLDADGDNWPPELPRNAYVYYRKEGLFKTGKPAADFVPLDWSDLHSDVITTGTPGALYNASFAIPRRDLPRALDAITTAILDAQLPPTFIFTARFVTRTSGTLAFTRFDETAVIEIDGASPWFMALMAELHADFAATANQLAMVVRDGARIVRGALENVGIDYSMHWAKLGELDAAKIERDFGPSDKPNSLLSRWRATREALLSDTASQLFRNKAIMDYGLVGEQSPPPNTL
jgi:FAD/FMN-containing dehydrogenase